MFDFLFGQSKKTGEVEPQSEAFSGLWLANIISDFSDAVVAYDEDFKILIFNKAASQIFGLRSEEILGQTISLASVKEPKLRRLSQIIFPSLAPRFTMRSESGVYPQTADVELDDLNLRVITNRIVGAGGAVQGFTKIIHDRTRELGILRSKSEFLTVAAHQLRTPLTAVDWAFEGLSKDGEMSAASKDLATTGGLAAKKLLKIVDDLLDAAKLEGGKYEYKFEEADFLVFLNQLLREAEPIAKEYGVRLFFDKPTGLATLPLTFDAQKLGVAISNIIDNAIKYNVPNGSVTITAERLADRPYVLVSIKDTGVGIPPADLPKLFTKFFRAENVMQFSTEGSGLGLYVTKNIITRHGGRIWAESELNRGTTFNFVLPTDAGLIPQKTFLEEEE